jgi:peptidoglycan/LPS O-acetylase OafA/YrhL
MFMGVLAITFVISDVTYRLLERPLRDVGRRITSTGSVRARRSAAAA